MEGGGPVLQQVQGWRGVGGRGWAVRSDQATRRTFRAAAMSMFSSVSKGQISKEGWKSCSLSRHLGEEPQLTGGCPTGSPVPPVPVAEPTSAAAPGGVPLCCWWRGSSPGAGAATAARTRRRQRSCRPDSPPEGTGTFRADHSGPPHGGGQAVKALPRGAASNQSRRLLASPTSASIAPPGGTDGLRAFAPRTLQHPPPLLLTS